MKTIVQERDPGLQPERTQLSWQRTSLSTFALTVLVFRTVMVSHNALLMGGSVLSIIMALFLVISSYQYCNNGQKYDFRFFAFRKMTVSLILTINALAQVMHYLI